MDTPYLMVMRTTQLVDMSLTPGEKTTGYFTPVIGIENGHDFDYDKEKGVLYYIQLEEDDKENVMLFYLLTFILYSSFCLFCFSIIFIDVIYFID